MIPVHALIPGTIVGGDFEVLSPIAEGGMGAVYLVLQKSTGKRRALKLIKRELLSDPKMQERFTQEARVGSRIESEHVVEVVSAGRDAASGATWLVMEYLDGEDLATFAERRGPLPPAEVREIFLQVCHALGAAHAVGIVHRDLKPENLFVSPPKRAGVSFTLKVLDFGIAKVVDESRRTSSATAAIGTPAWMAPEQAERTGAISPATDVWALGLIAFRLLSGRPYWTNANIDSSGLMTLLREVLFEEVVPASARAHGLGALHALPQGFDAWFARCVVRDPGRRFPNARALWEALEPLLREAPRSFAPPPPTVQAAPLPPPWPPTQRAAPLGPPPPPPPYLTTTSAPQTFPPAVTRPKPKRPAWVLVIAGIGAALATSLAMVLIGGAREADVKGAAIDLPPERMYTRLSVRDPAGGDVDSHAPIAADDKNVFYFARDAVGTDDALFSVPLAGGAATKLVEHVSRAEALAVDDERVYFTMSGASYKTQIMRMRKTGGAPELFADVSADAIAVDDARVYWIEGSHVVSSPKTSYEPTPLKHVGSVSRGALAVDSAALYVLAGDGTLVRASKSESGPPKTSIVIHGAMSGALAVDRGNVYWLRENTSKHAAELMSVAAVALSGEHVVARTTAANTSHATFAVKNGRFAFAGYDGLFVVVGPLK